MTDIPVGDVGEALGAAHLLAHRQLSSRLPALEQALDVNALEAMKARLDALEAHPIARGRIGSVQRITDFGHTGTGPQTVMTMNVTIPANRTVRLAVSFMGANCSASSDRSYLSIREGTTTHAQLQLVYGGWAFQSAGGSFHVDVTFPTAAAHAFNLIATGGSGANYNIQASAYGPLLLTAVDLGPFP